MVWENFLVCQSVTGCFSYLIFKRHKSQCQNSSNSEGVLPHLPHKLENVAPREVKKKTLTNSWKSREGGKRWRTWAPWTHEDSPTSAQLPIGYQAEAQRRAGRTLLSTLRKSHRRCLFSCDSLGFKRLKEHPQVWASTKIGAATTTSTVIPGEVLETKWEISTKMEVSLLRGSLLGRLGMGAQFQWQLGYQWLCDSYFWSALTWTALDSFEELITFLSSKKESHSCLDNKWFYIY